MEIDSAAHMPCISGKSGVEELNGIGCDIEQFDKFKIGSIAGIGRVIHQFRDHDRADGGSGIGCVWSVGFLSNKLLFAFTGNITPERDALLSRAKNKTMIV